ncbi:type I 3-dehydroquinate dehydratase [uncultured Desulfobulbus sp.]|uniref:type I 3-dehydroquinate dehydratase n=1 Tax=uncultured Desulfobulbus sp. TaxID=239745 RepID=UPI0029C7BC52|nr:type I 3-dehydroquinate dehydratase [uncultured Desulfobulbus sp.]
MVTRGLICASVMAGESTDILAAVSSVAALADVIEIRLDGLRDPRIASCIASLPKPVLVTNRPTWEGGRFTGSEKERIDLLCQALQWGARYVDIELLAAPDLRARIQRKAKKHGAQVIISNHDFQGTPNAEHLRATLQQMTSSGADIGKIVTTAASPEDALRILSLQEVAMAAHFPLSAFAMGAHGAISRLATLYLGGFMTYAALSPEQATAPGQITVQNLYTLLSLLEQNP